ncbi:MAG: LysR family transcriptional regulator [Candidatus Competibacterales bacterium]
MDRLHAMTAFVAVVDSGSFSKASQRLRLSPPAVTRAVSGLEEHLGVRLLHRTTRSLSLTEAGQRYVEACRQLLGDLDEVEQTLVGTPHDPSGRLTITASVTFGRLCVAPVLAAMLNHYPHLRVSLLAVDRVVNLVEEGIDVGVRIGPLADSSFIAKPLGQVLRVTVASPDYLARAGEPRHPQDLRDHALVGFTNLTPGREWRFWDGGKSLAVALAPRLEVNDPATALALIEAGSGIGIVLSYMVSEALGQGRLVRVLKDFTPPAVPVQLVYPHQRLLAPKVRAFIDFALPRLKASLAALPP